MYRLPVIIDVDTGLDDAMVLAMACALPVMATDASRPLLCENGVCGLTAPYGDAAAFADGLLRLLASPALRENLGKAAAEKVRSR